MTNDLIARLPKTDLHCHLTGTMTASTFAELARKARLELPEDPEVIFGNICSPAAAIGAYEGAVVPVPTEPAPDEPAKPYGLFVASQWARQSLVDPEDFARLTYEACANAFHSSNTRHVEMSFDPHEDYWRLSYAEVLDAYIAGIRRAEEEFGMTARLLQAIDRSKSAEDAVRSVRQAVEHADGTYLVGIGLDNLETSGPPERFAEAYALAESAGLRRTAHSSEHAMKAENTITCLDLLHCDRIDHGYFVLQDDAVVQRCAEEEVPFTVISTTSRRSIRPWRRASIRRMWDAGLTLVLASDDPGMFPTTLAAEYTIAEEQIGLTTEELVRICLNGWRACWLPDELKQQRVAEVEALAAAA